MQRIRGVWIRCVVVSFLGLPAAPAWGLVNANEKPPELAGVDVTEHLGAQVPLDASFRDEQGKPVTLGSYVTGEKPVILTLNYYDCPMLCNLQLNGLVDGLKGIPWTAGQEFEMVTVSISPEETPALATAKKGVYIAHYERPSAAAGWHFLTGAEGDIRALAKSVGFRYTRDDETGEYFHPAVAMLLSPTGTIVRYLYGIQQQPHTMKLGLLEAGNGTIGTTVDRLILNCFRYDPSANRYTFTAFWIMRIGALLTVITLGAFILRGLWRDAKRKRASHVGMVS